MCKFRLDLPNIKQTFYLQRHHMLLEFLTRFLQKSWEEGLCYCLRWVFLLAYCYSMICLSDTVFKPSQATGTCSRYVVAVRVLASGANCGLTMLLVLLLFRGVFFRSPGHPLPFPSLPLPRPSLKTNVSKFQVGLIVEGGRIGTLVLSFCEVGLAARRGQFGKR